MWCRDGQTDMDEVVKGEFSAEGRMLFVSVLDGSSPVLGRDQKAL
jgi:hypothetical protein